MICLKQQQQKETFLSGLRWKSTINATFVDNEGESHKVNLSVGKTVSESLQENGIDFDIPCGGLQKCGLCRVRLSKESKDPIGTKEKNVLSSTGIKDPKIRLGCAVKVTKDMEGMIIRADEM